MPVDLELSPSNGKIQTPDALTFDVLAMLMMLCVPDDGMSVYSVSFPLMPATAAIPSGSVNTP